MKRLPAVPRVAGVAIKGKLGPRYAEMLTPAALRFLAELHREFEARARAAARGARRAAGRYDAGELPDFLPDTTVIRDDPTGASRRSRPICRTAASRSPARSTAR